jgi:hypothetical protein
LAAVVFFASPLAVPLVKVPMVFFVPGAAALEVVFFLTAVVLLPSLVSLFALARRPVRVVGLDGGGLAAGATARRVLVAGGAAAADELALEFDAVVTFRVPPVRNDLTFSTKLDGMLEGAADRVAPFNGDPGRAIWDLAGDAARPPPFRRELEEVGDKTCPGRTAETSVACAARCFFLGFSMCSTSFSLSPLISSLRP